MAKYLGVDVGGTKIAAGIVDEKGKVIKKIIIPTGKGKFAITKNIFKVCDELNSREVESIGIGLPGIVKDGKLLFAPNLKIKNLDIKKMMQERYKKHVFADNDANAFTLGVATFGEGKNFDSVVGVTLGTGVGGGLSINKKIYSGRGGAAEFGHMSIDFGTDKVFEDLVSTRKIGKIANSLGFKDSLSMFIAAKNGNKKALRAWKTIGTNLGILCHHIALFYDPHIIVFGGNMSNAWPVFSKDMIKEAKKRAAVGLCKIVKTKLKDSEVIGAACLAINQ